MKPAERAAVADLEAAMLAGRVSVDRLARRCGVPRSTVAAWLAGKARIPRYAVTFAREERQEKE